MTATLNGMGKKKNDPADAQKTTKPSTDTVRIEADLAEMAAVIAMADSTTVSAFLSPYLREYLETRYAEAVRKLGNKFKRPSP